jgi:hypothetical protein
VAAGELDPLRRRKNGDWPTATACGHNALKCELHRSASKVETVQVTGESSLSAALLSLARLRSVKYGFHGHLKSYIVSFVQLNWEAL